MKIRKIIVSVFALLAIVLVIFVTLLFRRIDVVSPPLPQAGEWVSPKISTDASTGMASMEISVLDYNVAGLPFPIGCGKASRQTDEKGKRIPIACDRSEGVRAIGDALADLRVQGIEPDIILLQEAFIPAVAEIAGRAGYPNWIAGPGPNETGPKYSKRASESFITERRFWKGEKWGKRQPSGLLIASNFQISEQFNFPFYEWECAGFDCLANKGVMLARIRIPGLPDLLEIATTHYNAKKASGVPLERAHAAHRLQVDATLEFISQTSDYDLPMIWGGDLNMRRSEDRINYFVEQSGPDLNEVSSHCLEHPDTCRMRIRNKSDEPWFETQDLQGWGSGKRVTVEPISVEEIFDQPVDGKMLSDHSGFLVVYRLSWIDSGH
jgi:hypothetical protein